MPIDHPQNIQEPYRLGEHIYATIARLPVRDRMVIRQMGGLFPERENDFRGLARVLDIGSGLGCWAVGVARENPLMEVIGMESHQALVNYASGHAEAQEVTNASFALWRGERVRLPFVSNHFDLVNAHFLYSLLRGEEWLAFVNECVRVTRPGGYIRLIEPEWGITNSQALEQLSSLFLRGLKQVGYGLSPDGRHIGILPMLPYFLQQAGSTEIVQRVYASDYFLEPQILHNPALQMQHIAQEISPLILNQQLTSQKELEQLLRTAIEDVGGESFCGSAIFLAVCGRKPEVLNADTVVAS